MPTYKYKAYNAQGNLEQGTIQANSEAEAVQALHGRRLHVFKSQVLKEARSQWWNAQISLKPALSQSRLASLTREWSSSMAADLPLTDVLKLSLANTPDRKVRRLLRSLLKLLQEGQSFSQACAVHSQMFPPFYLAMLRTAEASGSLTQTTHDLANYLERSRDLREKITSALIYPLILSAVALVAIGIVVAVLIPSLAPILRDSGQSLPRTLAFLQTVYDILRSINFPMLVAGALTVFVLVAIWRNPAFAVARDAQLLRLPFIGNIVATTELVRFSSTLGLLLRNGVTLTTAMTIIQDLPTNRAVAKALRLVLPALKEGRSLSETLIESRIFPEVASGLLASGERSGRLVEMLLQIAQTFEATLQRRLERVVTVLPAALTVAMGLGVGSIMLSVFQALLSVNQVVAQ